VAIEDSVEAAALPVSATAWANPGLAQAHILWVAAGILLVVMVLLVFRVPEHKGSWLWRCRESQRRPYWPVAVSPSGNTSLSRPVLMSNTNPLMGTSDEIHGCDLAF
jgi:hypothetical protein